MKKLHASVIKPILECDNVLSTSADCSNQSHQNDRHYKKIVYIPGWTNHEKITRERDQTYYRI